MCVTTIHILVISILTISYYILEVNKAFGILYRPFFLSFYSYGFHIMHPYLLHLPISLLLPQAPAISSQIQNKI